jgi:hypothetical protein
MEENIIQEFRKKINNGKQTIFRGRAVIDLVTEAERLQKELAQARGRIAELEAITQSFLSVKASARISELEKGIMLACNAIRSTPIDTFGEGQDGELTWPIREEILDRLAKYLRPTQPAEVKGE